MIELSHPSLKTNTHNVSEGSMKKLIYNRYVNKHRIVPKKEICMGDPNNNIRLSCPVSTSVLGYQQKIDFGDDQ